VLAAAIDSEDTCRQRVIHLRGPGDRLTSACPGNVILKPSSRETNFSPRILLSPIPAAPRQQRTPREKVTRIARIISCHQIWYKRGAPFRGEAHARTLRSSWPCCLTVGRGSSLLGQITSNPLPAPIEKRGLAVQIKDLRTTA
jgi:hypothetical protein